MRQAVRATILGKKVIVIAIAFVLVTSSLTALTPFILYKEVRAQVLPTFGPLIIDIVPPSATFNSSNDDGTTVTLTNDDVVVTMTTTEPIETPTEWTEVDDTHFTKAHGENGEYMIVVTDLAGNDSEELTYEVKGIDKQPPIVTGITNGATLRGTVTFTITDENFSELFVNEVSASTTHIGDGNYQLNTPLQGNGVYAIKAIDEAGNETSLTITIDNSIVSTLNAIDDKTTTPVVSGTLHYSADGTPIANATLVIDVDGAAYPVTTGIDGSWSTAVTVANGSHFVTVTMTDDEAPASVVATTAFTTALPDPVDTGNEEGEEEDEGEVVETPIDTSEPILEIPTFVTPATIGPSTFADVLGSDTAEETTSSNTDEVADSPEVKGTSTVETLAAAVDADNTDGNALGLGWYWWLLILGAGSVTVWGIVAALRSRQADDM